MIENNYNIAFVTNLARREKQIQQSYRPIIAVHKWFARRPGTLFRSLMLAEFSNLPIEEAFYKAGDLSGRTIADPFMGGGTPLIEANRMGAHVLGCDINPMAYWIVRQEMEYLDLAEYRSAASTLRKELEKKIGYLYRTRCEFCGNPHANVKYFLWVKTTQCDNCGKLIDLFPGYLIAEDVRHPKNVFICAKCGHLVETSDRNKPGICTYCGEKISIEGVAKNNRCKCFHCGNIMKYLNSRTKPFTHRLFALEYYCKECKSKHTGRFFKTPDMEDLKKISDAENILNSLELKYVPNDIIPSGDETTRLHRWGYSNYSQLFNVRQLLGLEISCRLIDEQNDKRIRNALATNLSDLLRYQNMLCRYDTMALKSLDIFSIHGFPVGLVQCESNLLGIESGGKSPAGSGGWLNIIEKFTKAKMYCSKPFEVYHIKNGKTERKVVVDIPEEWIGDIKHGSPKRILNISCADATSYKWTPESLDGVFTDPPYFGNVQYAELMDFCYVWLRKLIGQDNPVFLPLSTRNTNELTGNDHMSRGIIEFTNGLSQIFSCTAAALKTKAPFVFTYHHNDMAAYYPIAVALLDAGLICTTVLPCPAEMGASIHIKGTKSSIVDSIFVCRRYNDIPIPKPNNIIDSVQNDIASLKNGGYKVTTGDILCIIYGHIVKLMVNDLIDNWKTQSINFDKLSIIDNWFHSFNNKNDLKLFDNIIK